jgi:hypothetical protein
MKDLDAPLNGLDDLQSWWLAPHCWLLASIGAANYRVSQSSPPRLVIACDDKDGL